MKAQRTIEREIEIVETIIAQLKECLVIFYKAKMYDEFKATLKDIETCKTELKKLKRNIQDQGEAKDGAKIQ
jgi:hypothetical protein